MRIVPFLFFFFRERERERKGERYFLLKYKAKTVVLGCDFTVVAHKVLVINLSQINDPSKML